MLWRPCRLHTYPRCGLVVSQLQSGTAEGGEEPIPLLSALSSFSNSDVRDADEGTTFQLRRKGFASNERQKVLNHLIDYLNGKR